MKVYQTKKFSKICIKIIIIIILFFGAIFHSTYSQDVKKPKFKKSNRIEQLEKVKLIESLNLTEEQSIRFFSRRNEHKKEIEQIEKRNQEIMAEMIKIIESDNIKDATLKKLNDEILFNREKIELKRKEFIQSLNDILTTKQISKLLLFEKRFREEIRDLIIKRKIQSQ